MSRANDTGARRDVIVVGVGGMGSAAVYHLARRGLDVLGLERYDVPHDMGSSHGETRIFRLVQTKHPDYVGLASRAGDLWDELAAETDRDLLHRTGSVHAGPADGEYVADAIECCEANAFEYDLLTGAELSERYPGYDLPASYRAVVQPDGGFLVPEDCIVGHVEGALDAGAEIRAREPAVDWRPVGDGVEVTTERGRYRADRLVVAAGAWTGEVLPALREHLTPERRVMAWFRPEAPERFTPESFPVFIVDGEDHHTYGFPIHDVPGIKIGRTPEDPEAVDPDRMDREPTDAEAARLRAAVEAQFPAAAGTTLGLKTCLLTRSHDGHHYLGRHPDHPQVAVAAGFTGHGFKFCSAVGEALADLSVDGVVEREYDLDLFALDRL
ncbi:N-methyl-L-tryptophan oxidase [Halorussus marinus]|uniref:N-methyl-L-tryptophan oxidase n=1 Tax=Halorussus marinus TaxID=2505976 RepID=UPI001FCF1D6A|nr:N-methyl-L-tryptophan oxidase [Halorussus marinus]